MCGFALQKRSCFTWRQRTHLAARMNFRPTLILKKKKRQSDGDALPIRTKEKATEGAFATPRAGALRHAVSKEVNHACTTEFHLGERATVPATPTANHKYRKVTSE